MVGLDLQIGSLVDTTLGRPISSTDLSRLNLYRSADASFDSSDVPIGVDSVLVVDGISTLRPFNVEVLPRGETFYIATARIDSLAAGGGAFSLGFPAGGFKVQGDSLGTAVVASDPNRVEITSFFETTRASGLLSVSNVNPGDEVGLFSIGVTGDSVATLVGLDLQIGSLLDTTLGRPISSTDLSRLNLYRSADASFDSSDVPIGVDSVLVVDGISTLRPFNVEVLPRGETFYIVTARIDSLAAGGGAFSLGFPAGGFKVQGDSLGTAVVASDPNRVEITSFFETTRASGLLSVSNVNPGDEVGLFSIGVTGDSVATLVGLDLQIGSLLDTTLGRPISSTDLSRLNLYRSADASFDSSDVPIGVDSVLVVDGISTLRPFNVEVLPRGETFYIATARIDSLAAGGGAFSLGFPAGGFKVQGDGLGTAVVASDPNRVEITSFFETTRASGLLSVSNVNPGDEVGLFSIGVTGDSVATLVGLDLQIGSLLDTTLGRPISSTDLSRLNLYRSADASFDSSDVPIGVDSVLVVDGISTLRPFNVEVLPRGETFYIATARIDSLAAGGGAFSLGFPAGGFKVQGDSLGTAVVASDPNRVEITSFFETTRASGLLSVSNVNPGDEVGLFSIGVTVIASPRWLGWICRLAAYSIRPWVVRFLRPIFRV